MENFDSEILLYLNILVREPTGYYRPPI